LPLVIGITGHRDLREEDRRGLEEGIRRIFAELRDRYPHTPLILLSSLAEGADRLAARVALDCQVRLVVPLPMSRALYEEDFETAASRAEFHELLQQAERWFELPLPQEKSGDRLCGHGTERELQYALQGVCIARECQILIALWDGVEGEKEGGTAQVVRFRLKGVPERYLRSRPLDPAECGPVYHLWTPRLSNPHPAGKPLTLRKLFPRSEYDSDEPEGRLNPGQEERSQSPGELPYTQIFARVNGFNRDALQLHSRYSMERERTRNFLFPEREWESLPAPLTLKSALKALREAYGIADSLADHFQRLAHRTLRGLIIMALPAVIFFECYSERWHPGLALYLLTLFAAYLWYWWARNGDYQSKYLDYRALAEGLRVQFFWRLADLNESVADHYLRKQRSELDWIRNAIRVWNLSPGDRSGQEAADAAASAPRLNLALTHWVNDQRNYYTRVTRRDHQKLERKERDVHGLLFLSLGLAVVLLVLDRMLGEMEEWAHTLLVMVASLAPAFAAALEAYAEKMAHSEQAKQFHWMSTLFSRASLRLTEFLQQGNLEEARAVIRELGEEALAENGDWVMLHRERPLKVSVGA